MRHYRICPCPMFDIAGTQQWLERMSEQGLHINTAFNWRIVGFQKGEPKQVRYRLDAAPDWGLGVERGTPAPEPETSLSYQEMGWEYVSNRNHFHIYASEDTAAPELHTDPRVQALSLKIVSRRLMRSVLWGIPLVVLWCWRIGTDGFYSALVSGEVYFPLVAALSYLTIVGGNLCDWLSVRNHRKELDRGKPLRPFSPGRKVLSLVLEVLPILMIAWMLFGFAPSAREQAEGIPMEEYTEVLEVPTAEELFPEGSLTEFDSTVYAWTTAASPDNLRLYQRFRLTRSDGGEIYGVWTVTRCDTAADWIARGYAQECVVHDTSRFTVEMLPLETELDFAAAYRITFNSTSQPNPPTIILCQGSTVLIGMLDLDDAPEAPDYQELASVLARWMN